MQFATNAGSKECIIDIESCAVTFSKEVKHMSTAIVRKALFRSVFFTHSFWGKKGLMGLLMLSE